MTNRRKEHREFVIDESRLKPAPTLFAHIKHSLTATFIGVLFIQAILFALGLGSIVLWWDNTLIILFLTISALMGWFFGDGFIHFLSTKIGDWWTFRGF